MTDTTVNSGAATPAANEPKKLNSIQDVENAYFAPSEIADKGMAALQSILGIPGIHDHIVFNGTWSKDENFPDTHGLMILEVGETVPVMQDIKNPDGTVTQKETDEKRRVTKMVVCAAVPTLSALQSSEAGVAFIQDGVLAKFQTKLRNSVLRVDDLSKAVLPLTIEEFIEKSDRGAADQGLKSYKELAPIMVKLLAEKRITTNTQMLREILQSSKFAEALMPNVKQSVWVTVLETFKKYATLPKYNLSTTIFEHWLATRDQAQNEIAVDEIEFTIAA